MVIQNMLRMHNGKWVFSEEKPRYVTALDIIKCLKHIKEKRWKFYKKTGEKALKCIFWGIPARHKLIRRGKKNNLKRGGGGQIEMHNIYP